MGSKLGYAIFYNLPLGRLPQNLSVPGQPPFFFP